MLLRTHCCPLHLLGSFIAVVVKCVPASLMGRRAGVASEDASSSSGERPNPSAGAANASRVGWKPSCRRGEGSEPGRGAAGATERLTSAKWADTSAAWRS